MLSFKKKEIIFDFFFCKLEHLSLKDLTHCLNGLAIWSEILLSKCNKAPLDKSYATWLESSLRKLKLSQVVIWSFLNCILNLQNVLLALLYIYKIILLYTFLNQLFEEKILEKA